MIEKSFILLKKGVFQKNIVFFAILKKKL